MGYRSDVFYALAWPNKDHAKEVLAVYAMDQRVIDHEVLLLDWTYYDKDGSLLMVYRNESVKWYEDFEDVQALERAEELAELFWQERKFPYACKFVRLGEDLEDVEERHFLAGEEAEDVYEDLHSMGYRRIEGGDPPIAYKPINKL
jgi:hypothetical protein|tara:strand:- start:331 stop:768 length:438 start_codon:yes stop_codon:yes gene_type:complete